MTRTQVFVVDASVAVKWVLNEPDRGPALDVLSRYRDGACELAAPQLLVYEVGNVLWKKSRRGELSPRQAERAFRFLQTNRPVLFDDDAVSASALRLAQAHERTFYDSLYLALALSLGCVLLTADRKLYNALENTFPSNLSLVGDEGSQE